MTITATFSDAEQTSVNATIDGVAWSGVSHTAILARDGQIATLIAEWIDAGNVIGLFVPPTPSLADFEAAIRAHLDVVAIGRDFDDRSDATTFTQSTKPEWAAESMVFIEWRDNVWIAFEAAKSNLPATVAEFISGLPAIVWPQS